MSPPTPLASGFRFGFDLSQRYGTPGTLMMLGGAAILLYILSRLLSGSRPARQERRENPAEKDGPPRFNG